jgi:hypothetical protein
MDVTDLVKVTLYLAGDFAGTGAVRDSDRARQ